MCDIIAAIAGIYKEHVLTGRVVHAVVSKEETSQYPLDRLNDMRALINYGPLYAEQCIAHADYLTAIAATPHLMSTGRLLRLHMALVLALGTTIQLNCSGDRASLVRLVTDLGRVLVLRVNAYPAAEDMSRQTAFVAIPSEDAETSRHALGIVWKLGELVDRLGMGEHVMYAHAPVATGPYGRVVRRGFFHQRKSTYFPHRLVVGIALQPASEYVHDVPIFRSRSVQPILTEDRAYVEITVDGRPVFVRDELADLNSALGAALRAVCDREDNAAKKFSPEVRKMILYSIELRDSDRRQGHIWRIPGQAHMAITGRVITRALGLNDEGGYAAPFFELIRDGLAALRAE